MDHTHGHLDYFINHFLKVGLTQNLKTVALRTLATIDLFYFIICEDPHDLKKNHWTCIGWGLGHIWLHTILEGLWPHYMILEAFWDGLWTLSFGLEQFHGRGKWLLGQFAHKAHGMWPLHFKHSHWWKRRSQSKFASQCARGTNGVCECKMGVKSTWIST